MFSVRPNRCPNYMQKKSADDKLATGRPSLTTIYPDGLDALFSVLASKSIVVCFSRLLKCLRSLYGKQCGPRSNCSYRSRLFWVHAVCFYTEFVINARQLFSADDFSRGHFQMHFFLGTLRVKLDWPCGPTSGLMFYWA